MPFTPHVRDRGPRAASFGLEASEKLGIASDRVFKTPMVDVDGELVVDVVPARARPAPSDRSHTDLPPSPDAFVRWNA